ncbi:DUF4262 domain-containing protein [Streptomyces antarcticus]|uniref:DUF4262 domain-containing protein n=1 Tax=Streptomyces antarcticus TaxID=2996458 RepID=UPI00226FCC30|nr:MULTISPECIES: DUF4262 domain-containing protein [unclassified Streptomyces]MCY0944828.1 DUF4262 domain-containing protein [Streptomyces sp. H34-AA3]MCY0953204.1 DUF4262 domain-containing protein [Streptomyces sp. H27-S2]MCZ4081139.1 DUF4262 domain-containing protein [Streptomyces sp. H34-S5]
MTADPFQCHCVLCHDYGDRDDADRMDLTIIGNVKRHGWHVVMVPEDDSGPGFAYTIGLAHTHSAPELAMFGLEIHAMHRMLNRMGEKAAAGAVLADGQRHPDVVGGRHVALRQVDLRWYRTFLRQAIGFYRRPPFPVLQVAWPAADDRFHWDEQAEESHRESQPQLWLPPSEHPAGMWTTEL